MPSRREFVGHIAGVGAGVLFSRAGLSGLQTGSRRRQVTIGGRRVKTIDAHAHTFVPAVAEVVKGTPLEAVVAASLNGSLIISDERLRRMDEQGIDVEVLSINPWWYSADRDLARRIIDVQNQGLAKLGAAQPDRFVPLATVAIQHPDLAVQQLDDAFRTHRMRGVSLGAAVNGEELAAPRFDPFWAKVEQLGALVFIHPQGVPELRGRLQGNGFLTNVIGNPLETTIALSHLIFEGTLDRFPRLKICGAHGGGFLPSYRGRFDQGCVTFPANCTKTLKKRPTEYLNQLYFDSMVFTSEGLRHLVAEYGASQIVMGTDDPFPWTSTSVDHILNTPGLSDADRVAMLGGNLSALLGIPS
jgi:aminocarboxymuconate-semialdehyde decarboxylase